MFLKQKRCGKIKERGCADGWKQRIYKSKEEVSSPTAHTESIFLTSLIKAHEGRDIAICDIPGAFIQANIDETIHIRMSGEVAEGLAKVNPAYYKRYMVMEKGQTVMYSN